MSPRLPALTGRQVIAVLQSRGFVVARQSDSHVILKHQDGQRVTVPVHAGRDLGRGLLRQIMRDADLTIDDFVD